MGEPVIPDILSEEDCKVKKASPFDFLNSINSDKNNMMLKEERMETEYEPFMVVRGLSQHGDTIMYANEMNKLSHLDNKMQYLYFLHTVRKKKRWGKWAKSKKDADIDQLREYYKYSREAATAAYKILSKDQLQSIWDIMDKGGVK